MNPTYRELFGELRERELLDASEHQAAVATVVAEIDDEGSRALALFSGVAAWFAAACLLLFLGMMELIDVGEPLTFALGGAFGVAAVLMKRFSMDSHPFGGQLMLALSFTAQAVAAVALVELPVLGILAVMTVVCGTLYALIPTRSNRLISAGILGLTSLAIVFDAKSELVFLMSFAASLITPTALFCLRERLSVAQYAALRPAAYVAACFGMVFALDAFPDLLFDELVVIQRISIAIAATVALSVAYLREEGRNAGRLLAGAVVVGLLGLFTTPGVLLSLLFAGLGFWRGSGAMAALGAVGLAGHLGVYYYDLDTTLLVKSGVLVASGLALIVVRLVMFRAKGAMDEA